MELLETVRGEAREVSRVRHTLADALTSWGIAGEDRDVAVLLTSEIVTNALRYGEPPVQLRAELTDQNLRVAVLDAGAQTSAVQPAQQTSWDDSGGRGLHLVEALAHRWGVLDVGEGKQVWFELRVAG